MDDKASAWLMRIVSAIGTLVNLYMLKKEYSNRKTDMGVNSIKYDRILSVWSFLTMISATLTSFFWFTSSIRSNFCVYGYKCGQFFTFGMKVYLTFFQIGRLQYCFSARHIHSKKYAYPNYLFYVLYLCGICGLICILVILWTDIGYASGKYMCYKIQGTINMRVILLGMLYYMWDISVMLLYIIKIIQIKRKKQQTETEDNNIIIMNRIYMILHKIVLLTICYEIVSAIAGVIAIFVGNKSIIGSIVKYLYLYAFDSIATSVIIYLMISHNNDQYIKLLNIVYASKLCCCFNCLMNKTIKWNEQQIVYETEMAYQPPELNHMVSIETATVTHNKLPTAIKQYSTLSQTVDIIYE